LKKDVVPALMSAVTHVHVGWGRGQADVDQPIIKDPMGIPFIPGSSVKGALKTKFLIEGGCTSSSNGGEGYCEKCAEVCCLFGGEMGGEGASRVVVADFYPLLIPVPSLDYGYVYVTSDSLLQYAESLGIKVIKGEGEGEEIFVGTQKVSVNAVHLDERVARLHPFLKRFLRSDSDKYVRVYKVDDDHLSRLVDAALVRLTRVKVARGTKTVERGKLWTEEYLPHGTVLAGAFVYRPWRNVYCERCERCEEIWERLKDVLLTIGGKETIGKGLVKITAF